MKLPVGNPLIYGPIHQRESVDLLVRWVSLLICPDSPRSHLLAQGNYQESHCKSFQVQSSGEQLYRKLNEKGTGALVMKSKGPENEWYVRVFKIRGGKRQRKKLNSDT